jgi:hypothetical protein
MNIWLLQNFYQNKILQPIVTNCYREKYNNKKSI